MRLFLISSTIFLSSYCFSYALDKQSEGKASPEIIQKDGALWIKEGEVNEFKVLTSTDNKVASYYISPTGEYFKAEHLNNVTGFLFLKGY